MRAKRVADLDVDRDGLAHRAPPLARQIRKSGESETGGKINLFAGLSERHKVKSRLSFSFNFAHMIYFHTNNT